VNLGNKLNRALEKILIQNKFNKMRNDPMGNGKSVIQSMSTNDYLTQGRKYSLHSKEEIIISDDQIKVILHILFYSFLSHFLNSSHMKNS